VSKSCLPDRKSAFQHTSKNAPSLHLMEALQDKLGLSRRNVSTLHFLSMSGGCQLLLLCSQAARETLQL
jgi:hypothetical protein